ncbi:hypothetical protein Lesp02_20760 [Lentzea sp. NBRC 105346]|uniref:hypothetical protein n=1 Tax=Lentzea sp. NBRC 105346 TaxID=3032205 RepID=UPI0024A25B33|nr:hypothetical protein [Lentzea sp. NBRC 105346]GLZ29886.1 hypothetical protein Lesp02_20760 [Lentzea sp. NBRC 105346]
MAADHPDPRPPDEVDAREIRASFGVQIARIRAELTSTWNKLRQVEEGPQDEERPA